MTAARSKVASLSKAEGRVPAPSTQALTDKQGRMELALQQTTSDVRNHIDECVRGQKRIEERFDGLDDRLDRMGEKLDGIVLAQSNAKSAAEALANAGRGKWWHPVVLTLVAGLVAGIIGALLSTIWNLEQEKITAAQARPPTQVTVNPPATVQSTPDPTSPPVVAQ